MGGVMEARAGGVRAAYEEAQRRKGEAMASTPDPESAPGIERAIRAHAPQPTSARHSQILRNVHDGVAWLARMCAEMDIDPRELLEVSEDIVGLTKANLRGAALGRDQCIEAGVGAGFFSGLWVGFLYAELKSGGST